MCQLPGTQFRSSFVSQKELFPSNFCNNKFHTPCQLCLISKEYKIEHSILLWRQANILWCKSDINQQLRVPPASAKTKNFLLWVLNQLIITMYMWFLSAYLQCVTYNAVWKLETRKLLLRQPCDRNPFPFTCVPSDNTLPPYWLLFMLTNILAGTVATSLPRKVQASDRRHLF